MPIVIQNKFDGGHAEDLRTFALDECEKSLNFDLFKNPHKLIPFPDSIADTLNSGNMSDIQISDIDVSLIGSTYYITGAGFESSVSQKTAFYIKLNGALASNFEQQAVSAAATYVKGTGVTYKDKNFALRYNGSGTWTLDRYDSAGVVTAIGTISFTISTAPRMFVHPEDNVLYIVIGTTISSWDGTTLTTSTTILPSGMTPTSLTDYGTYLAITMAPLRGNGNSITYLWGRDLTINTLQGTINWGEGYCPIVENLNNDLIAIMQPQNSFLNNVLNRIVVKGYFGGAVQTLKSISVATTDYVNKFKVKNENRLYFGSGNADDCVYVVGKNKSGQYIITKDRYLDNGTATTSGIQALAMIGDIMWRGINTVYKLMRSTTTYAATSVYKSTINPCMPIQDRNEQKQFEAFRISYTGKASGTIVLKYTVDGSTLTSIISVSTTAIEDLKECNAEITDEKQLLEGREMQYQIESTGGVEIKEVAYKYRVKPGLI